MDEDISRWVIEFMIRHSPSDQLTSKIISQLPVSNNNFRFKKTLLLRAIRTEISDGSLSETVLEILKQIGELDTKEGLTITRSMRAAYCAVAVDCTVRFLDGTAEEQSKYFEAVERIWRGETRNLFEDEELVNWRDEVEAAIWDADASNRLWEKNAHNHAVQMVKAYLEEAWTSLGPTFLELAAARVGHLNEQEPDEVGGRAAVVKEKSKGIRKEKVQPNRKHAASRRSTRGSVKIVDSEVLTSNEPCSEYDTLPTPDVIKVQDALKSSSLELQAIVTDPLPEALRQAKAVVADIARKYQVPKPSGDKAALNASVDSNPDPVQANKGNHDNLDQILKSFADKAVLVPSINDNVIQANKGQREGDGCSQQNNLPKPSLMERNITAQRYEWDDSIDGDPPNHTTRFHLPSPNRRVVSPLRINDITEFARRRKKKRWTVEEEEALRKGVAEFGRGNWKMILQSNPDAFLERTQGDLKDKWRNLTRSR